MGQILKMVELNSSGWRTMKVDTTALNEFFSIEGDDYMEMSEDFEILSHVGESWHTEESIERYKELRKGWRPNLGKTQSEEWRLNHAGVNPNGWRITYEDGNSEVIKNKNEWMRDYNFSKGSISMIKNGKLKSYKGIVKIEKIC